MSEMVERVARAICGAQGWRADEPSDTDREMARAAIEAMRSAEFQVRDESGVIHELRGAPMDTWRFLFDAALAPTSPATT